MAGRLWVSLVLAATLGPGVAWADDCYVMVQEAAGITHVNAPDFDMAVPGPLRLPTTTSRPSAVVCRRSNLAPLPNDYRALLELQLPTMLSSDGKIVAIELRSGEVHLDFEKANLTDIPTDAWRAWINKVQPYFYKDAPPPPRQ